MFHDDKNENIWNQEMNGGTVLIRNKSLEQ